MTMNSFTSLLPQFPGAVQFLVTERVFNKKGLEVCGQRFRYNLRTQSSEAGVSVVTIGDALAKQVSCRWRPVHCRCGLWWWTQSTCSRPAWSRASMKLFAAIFEFRQPSSNRPVRTFATHVFQVLPGGRVEIDGMTLKVINPELLGTAGRHDPRERRFAETDR